MNQEIQVHSLSLAIVPDAVLFPTGSATFGAGFRPLANANSSELAADILYTANCSF